MPIYHYVCLYDHLYVCMTACLYAGLCICLNVCRVVCMTISLLYACLLVSQKQCQSKYFNINKCYRIQQKRITITNAHKF